MRIPIYIVAFTALLAGCTSQAESTAEWGEGQVSLSSQTQIALEETSRASYELSSELIPSSDQFSLELSGSYTDSESGEQMSYSSSYESIEDYNAELPWLYKGDYIATISYGDTSIESATNACFSGELKFEVIARKQSEEAITATLSNSAIRVVTTEWFDNYYTDAEFSVTTAAGNTFDFTPNDGVVIFVPAECELTLEGSAKNSQTGASVTFSKSSIGATIAHKLNSITINAGQAGGSIIEITLDETLTEVNTEIELNPEA